MPSTSKDPSAFTTINPSYVDGRGFYTRASDVADMLQIPAFDTTTNPTLAQVGAIIKRVEGIIDSKVDTSYRPLVIEDEVHNFEYTRMPAQAYYGGYVGFVQLDKMKVGKVISLEVWQGSNYEELASARASIEFDESQYGQITNAVLTLPNGITFTLTGSENVGTLLGTSSFNKSFGARTTAQQFADLVNESFPKSTYQFTQETASKTVTGSVSSYNVSDFFRARIDSENPRRVFIHSLLNGEDGADCTLTATFTGSAVTVTNFTDKENMGRLSNWWNIDDEGRIFFLQEYPYHTNNSVRVTYVAGITRVPAEIHEAATKLTCAEILRHDDQTILIADTGAGIDTKTKYDILRKEAMDILTGKQAYVFLLD